MQNIYINFTITKIYIENFQKIDYSSTNSKNLTTKIQSDTFFELLFQTVE